MAEKERHGCLFAWLVLIIAGNSLFLLFYLLMLSDESMRRTYALEWVMRAIVVSLLNVVFAVGLFQRKKWGFYGLVGSVVVQSVIVFVIGLGPYAFVGLIGLAILYGVLRMGGERNAWDRLE